MREWKNESNKKCPSLRKIVMTDHVGKITISHARIKAQSQRQTAKGKTNFVVKKSKITGKTKSKQKNTL